MKVPLFYKNQKDNSKNKILQMNLQMEMDGGFVVVVQG